MEQETLKSRLRETLAKLFNENELRTLCFDLGVDYDNLGDDGKADKARELVGYFWRRGGLLMLTQAVEALRPLCHYGEYFRSTLREGSGTTQEIDIRALGRMRGTGTMGIEMDALLTLKNQVFRLRLAVWALAGFNAALVLIMLLS